MDGTSEKCFIRTKDHLMEKGQSDGDHLNRDNNNE